MNGQVAIVDFKVSSNLPSKKSIMDGAHLQLPFYSLIEPKVELFEYYFINISKNTTKKISSKNSIKVERPKKIEKPLCNKKSI